MMLALEEGYDRPSWWRNGTRRAEDSGQEVQPLFCMTDSWDLCNCEIPGPVTSQILEPYGQLDAWGEPLHEYVYCCFDSPSHRQDWREGRELSDEWSEAWVLETEQSHAHNIEEFLEARRRRKVHASDIRSADGIRGGAFGVGIDISDLVSGAEIRMDEDARRRFESLPSGTITVTFEQSFFHSGSGRESGQADSGGPPSAGTDGGGGTSALQT